MLRGRKEQEDNKINRYIRERVKQARLEANETQEDLAKVLYKNRVAVSDLERGRVAVSAADLAHIAAHYKKPVSYFFIPGVKVEGELSALEEELLTLLARLPDTQQRIALEYIRKQVEIVEAAETQEHREDMAEWKSDNPPPKE